MKARLLLAVLYMQHEDFAKAGRSLYKVLQIDKNNKKASRYMEYVKSRTWEGGCGAPEDEERVFPQADAGR